MSRIVVNISDVISTGAISDRTIDVQIDSEYQEDYSSLLSSDEYNLAVKIVKQAILSTADKEVNVHGSPGALFEYLLTDWKTIEINYVKDIDGQVYEDKTVLERNEKTNNNFYNALSCIQEIMQMEISALHRRIIERLKQERIRIEKELQQSEQLYALMQKIWAETEIALNKVNLLQNKIKQLSTKIEQLTNKSAETNNVLSRIYNRVKNFFGNLFGIFRKKVKKQQENIEKQIHQKEELLKELVSAQLELVNELEKLNALRKEFEQIARQFRKLKEAEKDIDRDNDRGFGGPGL